MKYLKMLCYGCGINYFESIVRQFGEKVLIPRLSRQGIERILWHRNQRYHVLLVSASLDIYLDHIGKFLGMDRVICTRLAQNGGILTGEMQGLNCKGVEKVKRLLEMYPEGQVDWENSYAYGDSITDFPVLERVGHPIVINPTSNVAALAVGRGWKIEYWT